MIQVLIIDDERPALRGLEALLRNYPDIEVAGMYTDPLEGIHMVGELSPDTVFLDVNMPQLNGIDAASAILDKNPQTRIVFVTAYDEYALEAFELYALDYLLKPVGPARLQKTIERLRRYQTDRGIKDTRKNTLQVRCFGSFEIGYSGREPIKWRTEKTKELFAYLLQQRRRDISKDTIIDALWQDDEYDKALRQLYNGVYYIRRALVEYGIDGDTLRIDGNYRLHLGTVDWDVDRFCALYQRKEDRMAALAEMEALYLGDYLAGAHYNWAFTERERLLTMYIHGVVELSKLYVAKERSTDAASILLKAYHANPYEEDVTESLLSLYRGTGNKTAALRHFQRYQRLLRTEMNISPDERIRRLAEW